MSRDVISRSGGGGECTYRGGGAAFTADRNYSYIVVYLRHSSSGYATVSYSGSGTVLYNGQAYKGYATAAVIQNVAKGDTVNTAHYDGGGFMLICE